MSSEVQTMADLDGEAPVAMQTPLYPIISLFGLLMIIGTLLTWATADNPEADVGGLTVSGLDSGGWGLAALITGAVIILLGALGYFWNPFSDPEAMLIGGFSFVALIAAIVKIADPISLFDEGDALFEFFEPAGSAGIGLWLVLIAALLSLGSALWILFSRPRAESSLDA